MTPVATVGGPTQTGAPESEPLSVGVERTKIVYRHPVLRGRVYSLKLSASARLIATIVPTDEGFVARCRELGSLGYGPDPQAALDDLIEATSEYLTFLSEDKPPLAPEIAHHSIYVALLGVPVAAWFVAISELQRPVRDAT